MNIPAINLKDGYKVDHRSQFPKETVCNVNNWTPRKSRDPNIKKVAWVGLQPFIKEWLIDYWNKTFFHVPKEIAVKKYMRRIKNTGNTELDYKHIEDLWDLQYLPISIWALPEGSLVNIGVPTFVSFNTPEHPEFYWVPGMLETLMSCELWKPATSATNALELRKILKHFSDLTCEDDIKLHDILLKQGHMSPFEHCGKVMTHDEYETHVKGVLSEDELAGQIKHENLGWSRNFKGFIQYREMIEK